MQDLLNHKKRCIRSQKNAFLSAIEKYLTDYGYQFERKKLGSFIKNVNLETKCHNPEYIFLAHYDTGTIIPFWVRWVMRLVGINRMIFLMIFMVALSYGLKYLLPFAPEPVQLGFSIVLWGSLLSILIPIPNNADDNTSGVIALVKLLHICKERGIDNVQCIFVDKEELGLFGSAAQRKHMEQQGLLSESTKIISLDCVGGSNTFPLIMKSGTSSLAHTVQKELEKTFPHVAMTRPQFPVSDNHSFKTYGAINISFVKKGVLPGGYYIKNIHSIKDTKIDLAQIDTLCNALADMVEGS